MHEVIQTEQFSTTLTILTEHSNAAQLKELSSSQGNIYAIFMLYFIYTDTYTVQYIYRDGAWHMSYQHTHLIMLTGSIFITLKT